MGAGGVQGCSAHPARGYADAASSRIESPAHIVNVIAHHHSVSHGHVEIGGTGSRDRVANEVGTVCVVITKRPETRIRQPVESAQSQLE